MALHTSTHRDATIASDKPVLSLRSLELFAPDRGDSLTVRVSAPLTGDALPVILFSHGFGSSMDAYGPLVDYWTGHGFVVIQPTHLDAKRLALASDDPRRSSFWLHRVADLKRCLDNLQTLIAQVPDLDGRVDSGRIAAVGHSFGAWAASMLLGARTNLDREDRADDRISAGVLLAAGGLGGKDLTPLAISNTPYLDSDFSGLTKPTLVVCGDDDHSPLTTRGPDWFRDPFVYSPGASALLTLHGSQHMLGGISGYGAAETDHEDPRQVSLVQRTTTAFLQTALECDSSAWPSLYERVVGEVSATGVIELK